MGVQHHALTPPVPAGPGLARKLYTLVVIHQAADKSNDQPTPSTSTTRVAASSTTRRRLLLGKKLRGFGIGFFNGYGGKVEPGESVEAAAARELTEEAGIVATDLHRRGVLTFTWSDQPGDLAWEVHVFGCTQYTGTPVVTDEMEPAWFEADVVDGGNAVAGLPHDRMWADDAHWYPILLDLVRQGDERPHACAYSEPAADGTSGPLFTGAFEFRNVTELVGGEVRRVAEGLPALPR
jgi:8-oxo-dGTP pyrophosphatase MutT (NUDIX family)